MEEVPMVESPIAELGDELVVEDLEVSAEEETPLPSPMSLFLGLDGEVAHILPSSLMSSF